MKTAHISILTELWKLFQKTINLIIYNELKFENRELQNNEKIVDRGIEYYIRSC